MRHVHPGPVLAAVLCTACGGGSAGDPDADVEDENQPPAIDSTPPAAVSVYMSYIYDVTCSDPEGDALILATEAGDTCGGDLADAGDGTGWYAFTPPEDGAGTSCTLEIECSDGLSSDVQSADVSIDPPADAADLAFGEFVPWATPITDYIEINEEGLGHSRFMKDIFDMTVFDGRLYLGYGDANLNLGRTTPIELRHWLVPDPDAVLSEFTVDEEQVSRFRVDGDLLVVPGIDATEDDFMGNAYTLEAGGSWVKSRTLEFGWHVHDAVRLGGTIWACGSGGTADDYTNSTVNAFLWRSDDGGETFAIHIQRPHPDPPGDQRLVHLVSVEDQLYACGYYSDGTYTYAMNFRVSGTTLFPWPDMGSFFVDGSYQLSRERGILKGVEVGSTLVPGTRLVGVTGVEAVESLAGMTLLDVEPLGDGRAIVLYVEDGTYPLPEEGPWTFHAAVLVDGTDLTDLVTQTTDMRPASIAFWRRSLYLGMPDGAVWRGEGS
jgi:hypothetical protein